MTAATADPVTLSLADGPDRVVIGDPWPVQADLRNDGTRAYPAPDAPGGWGIVFLLTGPEGALYEYGARERRQSTARSASRPRPSPPVQPGTTRSYEIDLSQIMTERPRPGMHDMQVRILDHGVELDGGAATVELVAPQVASADILYGGAADIPYGVFVRADLGPDMVVAVGEAPRGRPDLLTMRPATALRPGAAPRLTLPATFEAARPPVALALEEGGAAYAVSATPRRKGLAEPGPAVATGMARPRALAGVVDAEGAAWILVDAANTAVFALALLTDGTLSIQPMAPRAGGLAAAGALMTDHGPTLALVEAGPQGVQARFWNRGRGETPPRAVPAPDGRVVSLGLPRSFLTEKVYADMIIEGPESLLIARAPLLGQTGGASAAVPKTSVPVDQWIWPDLPTAPPMALGVVGTVAALLNLGAQGAEWIGSAEVSGEGAPMLLSPRGGRAWVVSTGGAEGLVLRQFEN